MHFNRSEAPRSLQPLYYLHSLDQGFLSPELFLRFVHYLRQTLHPPITIHQSSITDVCIYPTSTSPAPCEIVEQVAGVLHCFSTPTVKGSASLLCIKLSFWGKAETELFTRAAHVCSSQMLLQAKTEPQKQKRRSIDALVFFVQSGGLTPNVFRKQRHRGRRWRE